MFASSPIFLIFLLSFALKNVLSCKIGDVVYKEGISMGPVALDCLNETTYSAQLSFCGKNATIIPVNDATPEQVRCPESSPFCVKTKRESNLYIVCSSKVTHCCAPEEGPGGCPDGDGSFNDCWDEGGYCCSDGTWYGDNGDATTVRTTS